MLVCKWCSVNTRKTIESTNCCLNWQCLLHCTIQIAKSVESYAKAIENGIVLHDILLNITSYYMQLIWFRFSLSYSTIFVFVFVYCFFLSNSRRKIPMIINHETNSFHIVEYLYNVPLTIQSVQITAISATNFVTEKDIVPRFSTIKCIVWHLNIFNINCINFIILCYLYWVTNEAYSPSILLIPPTHKWIYSTKL